MSRIMHRMSGSCRSGPAGLGLAAPYRTLHRAQHDLRHHPDGDHAPMIIWIVVRIHAGSVRGAMSPKPTVEKTVTVK